LLEEASDFGAHLYEGEDEELMSGSERERRYMIRRAFHVLVRASVSPRFEKAMKDLLPWKV
jgi:hypothetical protein